MIWPPQNTGVFALSAGTSFMAGCMPCCGPQCRIQQEAVSGSGVYYADAISASAENVDGSGSLAGDVISFGGTATKPGSSPDCVPVPTNWLSAVSLYGGPSSPWGPLQLGEFVVSTPPGTTSADLTGSVVWRDTALNVGLALQEEIAHLAWGLPGFGDNPVVLNIFNDVGHSTYNAPSGCYDFSQTTGSQNGSIKINASYALSSSLISSFTKTLDGSNLVVGNEGSVNIVRGRLRMTGLTPGTEYAAAVFYARKLASDPGPFVRVGQWQAWTFVATNEVEYSDWIYLLPSPDVSDWQYIFDGCSIAATGTPPPGDYDTCYYAAYDAAYGSPFVPMSGAYLDGYNAGYAAAGGGVECNGWTPQTGDPHYNGPLGTCGDGTADGTLGGTSMGYAAGFNDGANQSDIDAGC
jgi:hypothetical protein